MNRRATRVGTFEICVPVCVALRMFIMHAGSDQSIAFCIHELAVPLVNIKLKYNFVETPRKFIIAELSIRELGTSSPVLIIMRLILADPVF